ncbi:hypothetical protein I4F81_009265 [Pyropia yezoensis]|uniref:Uncharacterized protein n=1 Tax=Pyropia yezoensis TaxID=2788 RepID=A0ACC3C9V0_PYRYE|nr:hypothetical protein I4F81_009265 [Neopyropia yezoensis]
MASGGGGSSSLLWVDKHRPTTLSRLTLHPDLTPRLRRLASGGDLPHLLFYGPAGGGKRTRILALLRELYGPGVERTKIEHRVLKVGTPPRAAEVTTVSSAYHIEVNASDAGPTADRLVTQQLVKEIASSSPLSTLVPTGGSGGGGGGGEGAPAGGRPPFKVIVLLDADLLSRGAQAALRRTMERYTRTCRLVLVADSVTKVAAPLRSRCLGLRVPAATPTAVGELLAGVARREGVALPAAVAADLVTAAGGNARRAVLGLEVAAAAAAATGTPLAPRHVVRADWQVAADEAAAQMVRAQSPDSLLAVRAKLYDLLGHAVPADVVLRRLVAELLGRVDQEHAPAICLWAARFDHRLATGAKAVVHLEAFAARFMAIYKQFLTEQAAMCDS